MMPNNVLTFLESSELYSFLFPFKLLFIIVTLFFLFAIFYYIVKAGFLIKDSKERLGNFLDPNKVKEEKSFTKRSKSISSFLDKKDYRRAIIMMEELFLDILNNLEIKGDDILEMISNSPISDIEGIKKISLLSEEARTNHNYVANIEELQKFFDSCEEALRRLKIIT